jgi:hypothetical protein
MFMGSRATVLPVTRQKEKAKRYFSGHVTRERPGR